MELCIKSDAKNGQQYQKWLFMESPFPLFLSFSASFRNSSPREKVRKLSSFWDWWAESLFVSIIVVKYIILPALIMASLKKKISGEVICSPYQRALLGFWARLRILNLIVQLCWLRYKIVYWQYALSQSE